MLLVQFIACAIALVVSGFNIWLLARLNGQRNYLEAKSRMMANQLQKITVAMNQGLRRSLTLQGEVQQMQQFLDDAVTKNPVEFLAHLQKHLERIDESIKREFEKDLKPDLRVLKDD